MNPKNLLKRSSGVIGGHLVTPGESLAVIGLEPHRGSGVTHPGYPAKLSSPRGEQMETYILLNINNIGDPRPPTPDDLLALVPQRLRLGSPPRPPITKMTPDDLESEVFNSQRKSEHV